MPMPEPDSKTRPCLLSLVSEPAEAPSHDASLLHLAEHRDSHARAADTLGGQVEVLHDLDHGGGAELGGLDRLVRVVVKLLERDGNGDLVFAEDEAIRKGLAELREELRAVGGRRAIAGNQLVVGAAAAANLNLVLALAGCDSKGLGDDILVDGGLAGRDRRDGGGSTGGEEGEEGDGVHYKGVTRVIICTRCVYVCIYIQGESGRVLPRIGKRKE
jgi:hypothetical protein